MAMQTMWGLFEKYEEAEEAVARLKASGFEDSNLNAVVQEQVVKDRLPLDLNKVGAATGGHAGAALLRGLDRLAGSQAPVPLADAGRVYAAGELATILTKTTEAPESPDGLKEALVDFGVSEPAAEAYTEGVRGGGVLLFVRSSDERAAMAAETLRGAKGKHVGSHPGGSANR